MKVAAIQMIAGSNVDDNLSQARDLLAQAANQGAELAVLPEYFCLIGAKDSDKLVIAESFGEGKSNRFCRKWQENWAFGWLVERYLCALLIQRVCETVLWFFLQMESA